MFRLFYSLQVLMEKRIPSFMPGMTSSVVHSTGSPDNFDIQQNFKVIFQPFYSNFECLKFFKARGMYKSRIIPSTI